MSDSLYDIIIIGAGPAGLTAGLYASRRTLKTLILSKDLGGQAAISYDVENYPGLDLIDGVTLMQKFAQHAQKFGAEIKYDEVTEIAKTENGFAVKTAKQNFQAQSLILAFGLSPRDLDIPGEQNFKGRGVSYCATCDGPLYKNKTVAVIGGGNSALDAAEYLAKIATKVYLIHRRDQFRGEELVVGQLKKNPKVEMILSSEILEIKGSQFVESIVIKHNGHGETREIKTDGIFVEIGYAAKTEFIKDLVKLNGQGEIITDKDTNTSAPGIFACGDVTDTSYKQIVISAGEGAKAALQAYRYLSLCQGKKILPDWEQKKVNC
ncbi:MAG: thioredoxin-disulfide reductase [Patescibacteria group bacterium]|jgi:thioredoxin reductase (NADPH)